MCGLDGLYLLPTASTMHTFVSKTPMTGLFPIDLTRSKFDSAI